MYTVLPGCVSLCVSSPVFFYMYLSKNKTLGLSCSIWDLHHSVQDLFFFNWGMWVLVS